MSFYIPDYIDEMCDPSADPLCILLAREGSNHEAYQTAVFHRANVQQIIARAMLEDNDEKLSDSEWKHKTRKQSSEVTVYTTTTTTTKRITRITRN